MNKALLQSAALLVTVAVCLGQEPGGSSLPAGSEILTLDQAIAVAIEHNRGLRSAGLAEQKAQDRWNASRTRLFPSFSVYALGAQQLRSFDFVLEKGVLGTYQGTGALPAEDVHLKSPLEPTGIFLGRVSQPLTGLKRIRRNLDTLQTGVRIAKEETRADRQKVVRDVKQVYYRLQQFESSLRTVRQTVALYKELAELTKNYVAGEVVLRSELLDIQTRLAKTEHSAEDLIDQQAGAKEQLNQLLGRDVLADFHVQPVLEASGDELDLVAARQRALAQRPEVRQATLRRQQAEQDLRAKRAEYIPDVSAEVNSMQFMNFGNYFPKQSMSVGVSVTWEPFDWGRKKHEIAEKRRTIEQTRDSRLEAESVVLLDVNEKFRKLRSTRTQLRVARMAQETAMESLRVAKNKYAVQTVLLKDVLQGQVSLEQSNGEYQQALLSFWNSRAEFERALGEDQ